MPQIFIDGKAYEAKPRQTIIQIADGINCGGVQQVDIPRFCYHPALSIAGNCRMCLVEVGTPKIDPATKSPVLDEHGNPVIAWSPKPLTACSTEISDGMHVKTHHTSAMVREAQKGVLEFILINHPLDCPTCDQAGECPLQQITYISMVLKVHATSLRKCINPSVWRGERKLHLTANAASTARAVCASLMNTPKPLIWKLFSVAGTTTRILLTPRRLMKILMP